tara:strand:- start:456 stop:704 length:249 start_codon:yes stop_codon:yes gene_type:complete
MRYGRNGRLYPLEMNQKSLFYLQMFLHQYKDDGLRDTDEKRRAYDHAMNQIRKGIAQVYARQNMNGLKPPRKYNFRSKNNGS